MKSLAVVIEWWHPLCTTKIEEKLKRKKETLCEKYFNRVRKILKLLNRESLCYIGETNFSISTHAEFAQYIYLRSHLCLELSAFDCTLFRSCAHDLGKLPVSRTALHTALSACVSLSQWLKPKIFLHSLPTTLTQLFLPTELLVTHATHGVKRLLSYIMKIRKEIQPKMPKL